MMFISESSNSCDNREPSSPTPPGPGHTFTRKPIDTIFFESVIERFDQMPNSEDLPPTLLGQ
jgi:hypothetical protein